MRCSSMALARRRKGGPGMEDLRFFMGATIFLVVALVIVTQSL